MKIDYSKTPKIFRSAGKSLSPFFPHLRMELLQSKIDANMREHLSYSLFVAVKTTVMMAIFFLFTAFIFNISDLYGFSLIIIPIFFIFSFYTSANKPKIQAKRRCRVIDGELPYAMRHLLIEIKSGIPLYQSLVAISHGYGVVSEEIREILADINGGASEIKAIESNLIKNPSFRYRKSMWQILNALKTGTSMQRPLESSVREIIKEQMIEIKKYGQELSPWTLMYTMFAIILPSLGITFIMMLSTFTGILLQQMHFYVILIGLILFQLMFLNIVKTKRPVIRL